METKGENICSNCGKSLSIGQVVLKGNTENKDEVFFCKPFCRAEYVFNKGISVKTEKTRIQ